MVQDHVPERVAAELVSREPEGLAVHRAPDGGMRLSFGLASRDSLSGSLRFQSIFSEDVLV